MRKVGLEAGHEPAEEVVERRLAPARVVGAEQDPLRPNALDQVEDLRVRPVLDPADPVVAEPGARGGELAMEAGIGVTVEMREHDPASGNAEPGQELEQLRAERPLLGVDADRRAGRCMRCGRSLERPPLERADPVVAGAGLDRAAPIGELRREAVGELLDSAGEPIRIVGFTVKAGAGDDVEPGRARHGDESVEVAAETERRPLDERGGSGGSQRTDVLDRRVEVVQLLAGKQRRREEDVLVGGARPELLWRNRP